MLGNGGSAASGSFELTRRNDCGLGRLNIAFRFSSDPLARGLSTLHTQVRSETLHIRGSQVAVVTVVTLLEEVSMPELLRNDRHSGQDREGLRILFS